VEWRSGTRGSDRSTRLRATAVLAVMAVVLVPVAIAWACNPQANLRLDNPSYGPGDRIGVSGAFFKGNADLTITIEPGGSSTTVRAASNGFFATSITAPSTPGSYTVSAIGFESDGTVTPGLPARASFQVSPVSQAPQGGGSPTGPTTQPGATAPGANQPRTGRFAEPKVPRATPFPSGKRRKSPTTRGRSGAGDRTAAVTTGAGVIKRPGGAVFAGSVARADRPAAVASPGKRGKARETKGGAKTTTPSERSALGDVWSGVASANAPSLLPKASDAAPSGGGTGFQLIWGLALIGISSVALAGGLAAAGARRRKARAG